MTLPRPIPLPDQDARRRAVTDFSTNLVVVAGAGTGKTSLLVERVLNAVGGGSVEIDHLAAITFTEKAAAEMRERLAEGLQQLHALAAGKLSADEDSSARRAYVHLSAELRMPQGEIAAHALSALEKLDQAKISTIHGFCSELLRAHPLEALVDPDFEVDTGDQAEALAQEAWERFVSEEFRGEAPRAELWARLLSTLRLDLVGEIASRFACYDVPDDLLRSPQPAPTIMDLFGEEIGTLIAELDTVLERGKGLRSNAQFFLESARTVLGELAQGGVAALTAHLARNPKFRKLLKGGDASGGKLLTGIPPERVEAVYRRSRRLIRELSACDERLTDLLVEVIAPFALDFREELLQRGWVSFDALLVLARNLLRDHPDVRRELKERYRLLLVDEFQDTDPLQYEIVLFLAEAEHEAATESYEARLAPGKLFVVGDPKQSIYRFRGADYTAFQKAVQRVSEQGGAALDLTGNFRSVPGIVQPLNALFEVGRSACWAESRVQPSYEPIRAVRPASDVPSPVELWTIDVSAETTAAERRRIEGRLVAAEIERLAGQGVPYSKISMLFRAFANIPPYLRPLRERGIPFVVDGGKDFLKRPEVAQLLAALRTLAQPSDPTALLAFLRSPAGGATDAELAAYAAEGGRWDWRAEIDAGRFHRIAAGFDLLQQLRRETRNLPADATVARVFDETRLLPLAAAGYEGAQRVANLEKLRAAAVRLARDGALSLEDVVDALQEGGLADLEADSPLADDAADAVRITSIHKMKGLENDWVFLPDLAREDYNVPPRPLAIEVAKPPGMRPALALHVSSLTNPAWIWLQSDKKRHEEAEELRVLYVALTRARERLVLLVTPSTKHGRWVRALDAWDYHAFLPPPDGARLEGGCVLHRVVPVEATLARAPVETVERAPSLVTRYTEAVESWRRAGTPAFRSPSAEDDTEVARYQPRELDGVPLPRPRSRDYGKAVGIVAHRLLERWDRGLERLQRELGRFCRELAVEHDLDPPALERESRAVFELLLGSPLAATLGAVKPLGREVPLLLRAADGSVWRGSIDLIYRDEQGEVVIADYKTDDSADEASLVERYRAQLDVYATAVQRSLNLLARPRTELWLLRSGRRVEVRPLTPSF